MSKLVQKRPASIRDQILAALAEKNLSSKEITELMKFHPESIKHIRSDMALKGQIIEVGMRLGNKGVGSEKIWGLPKPKVKAVNAFDWRNWEPQANFSAREIAYSNSQFYNRTEKRVIVYSRA